jgi:hypothetical protein
MSDPHRRYPGGGPEPLERLVRTGFDSVLGRIDAMTERLERLEAEVAALRERASATRATVPKPPPARPAVSPPPSSRPEPAGPPAPHIDETLVWGVPDRTRPERARPTGDPGSSGPERFAAEVGEHADPEGSSLGRMLRRRRPEQEPTG